MRVVDCVNRPFHIIDVPEELPPYYSERFRVPFKSAQDVYAAVGFVLEAVQEWEDEYRDYLSMKTGESKTGTPLTLGTLTEMLRECNDIDGNQLASIHKVVCARNKFVHTAFVSSSISVDLEQAREQLNYFLFAVYECRDLVANLADGGNRPTMFTEED